MKDSFILLDEPFNVTKYVIGPNGIVDIQTNEKKSFVKQKKIIRLVKQVKKILIC